MATTRESLDTTAESLIQIFNDNEEELLTSHMASNTFPDITDENKFGGESLPRLPISFYGEVGFPHAFDIDYQAGLQKALEDRRRSLDMAAQPYHTDDVLGVLIHQTAEEQLKVKNLLDHYLNPREGAAGGRSVEAYIINGKQYPRPMVESPGDFKGSTGDFSRYNGGNSYDGTWFRNQGSGYTQSPTSDELIRAGRHGLIVGQIDPTIFYGIGRPVDTLSGEAQQLVYDLFDDPNSDFQSLLGMLPGIKHDLGNQDLGDIRRISQLYKPGFPRPPEPFITQKILHETLQQNLLLPVNIPNTASSNISAPQNDSPYNVFSNTYLSNRSAGVVPSYSDGVDTRNYNKGMMAGTAIEDLEYQDGSMLDHRTAHGGPIPKVINFEDDRSRYSQSRKDAGFDSNIPRGTGHAGNMRSPDMNSYAGLGSPAVRSLNNTDIKPRDAEKLVHDAGNSQYFPFVFSTVNKRNKWQACYFQATISQFSEGFTPTWAPKSYLGRSEQVHTYTFTDRTMDIEFSLFATTARNLQNVYERVLWLSQQCYPDYDEKRNLQDGPLIAMRIGDLIPYQEGFIKNLGYSWDFLGEGGKWELSPKRRMPQGCKVSLSFQPIHRRVPDRNFNFYSSRGSSMADTFVGQRDSNGIAKGNFDETEYNIPTLDTPNPGVHEGYYLREISNHRVSTSYKGNGDETVITNTAAEE